MQYPCCGQYGLISKPQYYDVIIAGSGVIGASIAFQLATKGLRVAILDVQGPSAAASGACDGVLSICTKTSEVLSRLALQSINYTEELSENGKLLSGIFRKRPSYYFSTDDAEDLALDNMCEVLKQLGGSVSVRTDRPSSNSIPYLGDKVRRVINVQGEGHMLGYLAVNAYLNAANIHRIWPCELIEIEAKNSSIEMETSKGLFAAGYLVLALGVATQKFVSDIPIIPRVGQLIITDQETNNSSLDGTLTSASYLLSKTRQHPATAPPIVVDPLTTGQYLIGSSRENTHDPRMTSFNTAKRLLTQAASCYRPINNRRVLRVFAGVRAAVADGLPLVGPLPSNSRVVLATGFEGDGICLCSLIGRDVANMVVGEAISEDLYSLSPSRFLSDLEQRI